MDQTHPLAAAPNRPSPDRSVKVPHLVFALLFLGLAGVWALVASGTLGADGLPLIGPGVLIAAGAVGLVATLTNGRNRRRRASYAHTGVAATPDTGTDLDDTTHDTEELR